MSANGDGQGHAQGQAQGAANGQANQGAAVQDAVLRAAQLAAAADPNYVWPALGTIEWAELFAEVVNRALNEPELPEPLAEQELQDLQAYLERNDELNDFETWEFGFLQRLKADYDAQLANYRAYFGISVPQNANDVNENDNNE